MIIKKDDLLRPTRNHARTVKVMFTYSCGTFAMIYCPTVGRGEVRHIDLYGGWAIERDGKHVGTV